MRRSQGEDQGRICDEEARCGLCGGRREQASRKFNGLIRLSPAGAFLRETIRQGVVTRETLISAMQARYEDLNETTARQDPEGFPETTAFALKE